MPARSRLRLNAAFALCALFALAPTASRAENAAASEIHPALWRIRHDNATVYLFGSLHVLPQGFRWTTPTIDSAKAASDRFIFEVPVDEAAMKDEKQFIIAHGLLSKGQTLRGILSGTEFQTYSAVLRRAGMKQEQFERFRPWLAAVVLGLAYLHSDNLKNLRGADDDLMDYARDHGHPLSYLESVRDQMELFNHDAVSDQLKALKSLIVTLPSSRGQERDLLGKWASGDAAGLNALLAGYFRGHPEARAVLVGNRNRNWLPTIKAALARPSGATMITVGAAHIGGIDGLVALLCEDGYTVEQLGQGENTLNACGRES
jgi:uncharacterized protein YbaP (TraB family)